METVTIQIGNSDNKLSQKSWSEFIGKTRSLVESYCQEIHFDGGSRHDAPWQNACFVAIVDTDRKGSLCDLLEMLRMEFYQESVAVTFGQTQMV